MWCVDDKGGLQDTFNDDALIMLAGLVIILGPCMLQGVSMNKWSLQSPRLASCMCSCVQRCLLIGWCVMCIECDAQCLLKEIMKILNGEVMQFAFSNDDCGRHRQGESNRSCFQHWTDLLHLTPEGLSVGNSNMSCKELKTRRNSIEHCETDAAGGKALMGKASM